MKSPRVSRTLDGLIAAAQDDAPSDAALARLADDVEAGPASTTRRVVARLSTPRGLLILAACLVATGALATTLSRDGAPLIAPAAPVVASPHTPIADRTARAPQENHGIDRPKDEVPTVDVRSLPSTVAPPARREAPPAATDEALSEGALLQLAHDAVAADPHRALALTAEHERRFPHGMLVQEREVIAVEALATMGDLGGARARAAAFLATYPGSAYRSRVADALAPTTPSPSRAP